MGIYDFSVAHRSRQNEIRDIGLSGQDDLQVGFGERFTSANELTFNRYTPMGRDRVFEQKYRERDQVLKDAGLIENQLLTTKRIMDRVDSGNYPNIKSDDLGRPIQKDENGKFQFIDFEEFLEDNAKNDTILHDLISANPELGIMSDEQISSLVMMEQLEILHRDEDLAERSTFLGKVGFITGAAVGWIRDPSHFITSLVGLTPLGRLSMSANFMRVGAAEATIVGALELREKEGEVAFRRRTGEPELTAQEAFIESGIAVGTAGILGGTVGAVIGRFTRAIPPSTNNANNAVTDETQQIVDSIRQSQSRGTQFDPDIEQAADLLDEALQIARSAPEDISYESHMNNYSNARVAIAEGSNVGGADDLGSLTRASNQDVEAPIASQTAIPDATPDAQDIAILDLRNTLEKEDILTSGPNEVGDITTSSSRQLLADLDSEEAAVRATLDCLG